MGDGQSPALHMLCTYLQHMLLPERRTPRQAGQPWPGAPEAAPSHFCGDPGETAEHKCSLRAPKGLFAGLVRRGCAAGCTGQEGHPIQTRVDTGNQPGLEGPRLRGSEHIFMCAGEEFCGKMRSPAGPRQEGNSPWQSRPRCEAVSNPGDCTNNSAIPRESLLRSLFFPLNFSDEGSNSRSNGTDLAGDQRH